MKIENDIRLSKKGQLRFHEAEKSIDTDWMNVASEIQKEALRLAEIEVTGENLSILRNTALKNPDLALYVKNNKCRQTHLKVNDECPNFELYNLKNSKMEKNIFNSDKYEIIIAGSVSWPPFRGVLKDIHKLSIELSNKANFKIVYITEAHASDVWPISSSRYSYDGNDVNIKTPKTTEERIKIASEFCINYEITIPIYVDGIDDNFEKIMAPWPIRFYIIKNGIIKFIAQPEKCSYDISQIRNFIK